tara:strand:+ start:2380 stop:2592 length:213 start_codon:yes stop_codon:yes gene_type:complete
MEESIYQEGLRLGWEMNNYYSDLYVVDCPELRESITRRKLKAVSFFIDEVSGEYTADLFGEYEPWREARA